MGTYPDYISPEIGLPFAGVLWVVFIVMVWADRRTK